MADPGNSAIVLSGCGTSGRIGFIVARAFNRIMEAAGRQPCFHYLCAGGDPALFTSYEAPEDNVAAGREALEAASAGAFARRSSPPLELLSLSLSLSLPPSLHPRIYPVWSCALSLLLSFFPAPPRPPSLSLSLSLSRSLSVRLSVSVFLAPHPTGDISLHGVALVSAQAAQPPG